MDTFYSFSSSRSGPRRLLWLPEAKRCERFLMSLNVYNKYVFESKEMVSGVLLSPTTSYMLWSASTRFARVGFVVSRNKLLSVCHQPAQHQPLITRLPSHAFRRRALR